MVAVSHDAMREEAKAAADIAAGARSIAIRGSQIDSRELFTSGREITIAHGEETYRLRLTSQNKLILTK